LPKKPGLCAAQNQGGDNIGWRTMVDPWQETKGTKGGCRKGVNIKATALFHRGKKKHFF